MTDSKNTESKPGKFLHDVKGPPVLTPTEIKDIVESRPLAHSRAELAKKYGISINRVSNIWKEYYGGSTLNDYKSGLKKDLPLADVKTADITHRKFKSERGTYMAKEPKVVAESNDSTLRAKVVRKQLPAKKKHIDLDLDNVEDMGDTEAQIMAGEINAGNNSAELLDAIAAMLEHNQNISERAVQSLEYALSLSSQKNNAVEDYSDNSIESEYSDDDSTATYRKPTKHQPTTQDRHKSQSEYPSRSRDNGQLQEHIQVAHQRSPNILRDSQIRPQKSGVNSTTMAVHEDSNQRLVRHDRLAQRPQQADNRRDGRRARPVYSAGQSTGTEQRQIQEDNIHAAGHESAISSAKHNASQGRIQQDNVHDGDQYGSQSGQVNGLHSSSRNGSRQAVSGVSVTRVGTTPSWIKRR